MDIIKFRQPIYRDGKFDRFRHWGRIGVGFTMPILPGNCDGEIKPDEQFIGRKDKNGKEIYKGDLIHVDGDRMLKVVWNVDSWVLLVQAPKEETPYYWNFENWDTLEVTGNIHESEGK